jgi:hypothetical protein
MRPFLSFKLSVHGAFVRFFSVYGMQSGMGNLLFSVSRFCRDAQMNN